ncbi:MAG: phospholipase [Planctomycetes bacterium]|nr:phospholipase [Planctomycetota bacterium]
MEFTVVFVHGWSVTNTNTYGQLPQRLVDEATARGHVIKTRQIYLGRYISFHDEVEVADIARAFAKAVEEELDPASGKRFVCITHSTGGPVIREWWRRYHQGEGATLCPMSHLIMLAPANYGSALAVLGKGKLSRLKSWWDGVEPGQGVLDWLVLGSAEAWNLNEAWIKSKGRHLGPDGVFPFVITGQTIDRALYDHLNNYTGELGSDGVVRVAAANLQSNFVRLEQQAPVEVPGKAGVFHAPELEVAQVIAAPKTPLRIMAGKSHSGTTKGIMRSVKAAVGRKADAETVDAIFACMTVDSVAGYEAIADQFAAASAEVQSDELLEVERKRLWWDSYFIHDRFSMVIFRITDHEGHPVTDFDLVLTAGEDSSPDHLPKGFFADRQLNPKSRNTVTYYLNHSIMAGCDPVLDTDDDGKPKEVRPRVVGATSLGFRVTARPDSGFAHYLPCSLTASADVLKKVVVPNATTMVDIVLQRVVGEGTFRLDRGVDSGSFKSTRPGKPIDA